MKIECRVSIIFACILFLSFNAVAAYAGSAKSAIAVLDFESVGAEHHLGKAIAEIMRTELIGTNKFSVVERAQINKALSEQQFQRSGIIDDQSAVQVGKLIGADLIIVGSVVKIGSSYTINSRMIDVKTGEARLGKNVSGNDLNLLTGMSHKLIQSLFGANKDMPGVDDQSSTQASRSSLSIPRAAVNWGNGKAYFFRGSQYIRFDIKEGRTDAGYPKPINSGTWPGLIWIKGVDAAVNWGNGKAYFFRGGQYVRYDVASDRVDPGYPQPINSQTWPGLVWTDGIDAAVNWGSGKAYFFRGNQYIRYDIKADRADFGYPKPIDAQTWPGMIWTDGIDDVVAWNNGKAYFFRGNQFIQYDIEEDRADPGYPKKIDDESWPGLVW